MYRKMIGKATVATTAKNYATAMKHWHAFCEWEEYDLLDHSKRTIQNFVIYLCYYTKVMSKGARACLTALSDFFGQERVSWSRSDCPDPILRKLLRAYDRIKPSKICKRKPICLEFLHKFQDQFDMNEYESFLNWTILVTAYYFGLRVGEYAVRTLKGGAGKILYFKDLTITGKKGPGRGQAILNVCKHKGDKLGKRDAHVPVQCNRNCTGDDDMLCPVHVLKRYVEWRNQIHEAKGPLFIKRDGYTVRQQEVNNVIKACILTIGLDDTGYSSHCLRAGRATDLARAGVASRDIKKWGRWLSDCWEAYYLKLDLTDIARATQISLQDLRLANTNPERHTIRQSPVQNACGGFQFVTHNEMIGIIKEMIEEIRTDQTKSKTAPKKKQQRIYRAGSAPSLSELLPVLGAATPPKRSATYSGEQMEGVKRRHRKKKNISKPDKNKKQKKKNKKRKDRYIEDDFCVNDDSSVEFY